MVDNHQGESVPVVDVAALLTITYGDREVLRQLIEIFLEDAPGQLDEIRAAVARSDRPLLEQRAHSLRGAAASMAGARVAAVASRLEAAARTGDLADVDSDYGLLTVEVALLRDALLQVREEHGA